MDSVNKDIVKPKVITQKKIDNIFQKTNHFNNNKTCRGKGVERFEVFSDTCYNKNELKKDYSCSSENTAKIQMFGTLILHI